MVEVAKQQASNPVHDIAKAIPVLQEIPKSWLPPPKLDMPNKLLVPVYFPISSFIDSNGALSAHRGDDGEKREETESPWFILAGYVMLGLGDIALPALLM